MGKRILIVNLLDTDLPEHVRHTFFLGEHRAQYNSFEPDYVEIRNGDTIPDGNIQAAVVFLPANNYMYTRAIDVVEQIKYWLGYDIPYLVLPVNDEHRAGGDSFYADDAEMQMIKAMQKSMRTP